MADSNSDRSGSQPTMAGDSATVPHLPVGSSEHGSSPKAVRLPEQFGRYTILRTLGEGAMGAVYLAHDTVLDRRVALKVPHFGPRDAAIAAQRFQREARAAAALQHPNLCPVFDVGKIDGIDYLTMPFISGETLSERCQRDAPMAPNDAIPLLVPVADALEVAHRAGIIHRDLKPSNILLNERGEPVVTDFGLSRRLSATDPRLSDADMIVGTPAYMPPEQVSGELGELGPAADVYSLGVIFYRLLTGRVPFDGTLMEVLQQVLLDDINPPSERVPGLDSRIDDVCMKALAKDPRRRYSSMAEFAAALKGCMVEPAEHSARSSLPRSESASVVPPASPAESRRQKSRRRSWAMLAVAIIVLSGFAVLAAKLGFQRAVGVPADSFAAGRIWQGSFQFVPTGGTGSVELRVTERSADSFRGEYTTENRYRWSVEGTASDGRVTWKLIRALNADSARTGAAGQAFAEGTYSGERVEALYTDHDSQARIQLSLRP